jgi:hypothetical protein
MEMRTIKFRGKYSKAGNWVYGYYVKRNWLHYISPKHNDISIDRRKWNDGWIEVNPETIGQFTGLYDSTKYGDLSLPEQALWTLSGNPANKWLGREIYENDILSFVPMGHPKFRKPFRPFVVHWKENQARFSDWSPRDKIYKIGNTHDNPELMESE